MVEVTEDEFDENLWKLFTEGISSFFKLMSDGRWVEVVLRIGIFIGLVFVVHALFVWILHSIVIPLLQKYFMDKFFDELKKQLKLGQFQQYTLGDLDKSKDWTTIFGSWFNKG